MNDKQLTALIIDDNTNIKILGSILRRNGLNVLASLNGKEGIEIALRKAPQIILLDIQMPEMDGYEVCAILKNSFETKDIPIIFVTASNDDDTIRKIFSLGASDYAQKPFSEIELLSRIKFHIKLAETERIMRKALIDAIEASRAKSEFLSNISHEIRTPLNSIIGYSEILLEEETDKRKSEKLNRIVSSSQHLLSLINSLLDLSKIEAKKIEINKQRFSFYELLKKIENIFLVIKDKKKINFNITKTNNIPNNLLGDKQKIEQILINLLNNSFKFTEKGQVDLICTYEEDKLRFRVKDTGIGIKEEDKENLFKSFQQANSEINIRYGGTGLGLKISKELALLMGGNLTFESTYGLGTEFVLEISVLPWEENLDFSKKDNFVDLWLKEDPEIEDLILKSIPKIPDKIKNLEELFKSGKYDELSFELHKAKGFFGNYYMKEFFSSIEKMEVFLEKEEFDYIYEELLKSYDLVTQIPEKYLTPKQTESQNKEKLRIIVADDVEDNRELVGLILRTMNVDIDYAENGLQLLQKMKEKTYDVVLLDIQMPEMNGKTTIKNIRNDNSFDNTIVIALSAQAYDSDKELMLGLGCDGYMTKPINKQLLRDQIRLISKERGRVIDV